VNSKEKRKNVQSDYDLVANDYCQEFGTIIEDKELVDKFISFLTPNAFVVDLGGGSGKVSNYLNNKGFSAVCYDFSENMMHSAKRLFPSLPYVLDDMLNINKHYKANSVNGIIALYSLFHIPKENLKQLFVDIYKVLKQDGVFCCSFSLGKGEEFVDEPYLKERGKNALFMNFVAKQELYKLLKDVDFDIVYETEKREIGDNVLGENGNDAIYIIAKK